MKPNVEWLNIYPINNPFHEQELVYLNTENLYQQMKIVWINITIRDEAFRSQLLSTGQCQVHGGQCHGGLFFFDIPGSGHQAAAKIASLYSPLHQFYICSSAFKICPPNICVQSSFKMLQFFAIFCHHPNILCELVAPHRPPLHCVAC